MFDTGDLFRRRDSRNTSRQAMRNLLFVRWSVGDALVGYARALMPRAIPQNATAAPPKRSDLRTTLSRRLIVEHRVGPDRANRSATHRQAGRRNTACPLASPLIHTSSVPNERWRARRPCAIATRVPGVQSITTRPHPLGYVRNAVFIDDDECAVDHVEMATFDVEDGQPFFDRKGFERWKESAISKKSSLALMPYCQNRDSLASSISNKDYVTRLGRTRLTISRKNGCSWRNLAAANGKALQNPERLGNGFSTRPSAARRSRAARRSNRRCKSSARGASRTAAHRALLPDCCIAASSEVSRRPASLPPYVLARRAPSSRHKPRAMNCPSTSRRFDVQLHYLSTKPESVFAFAQQGFSGST